MNLQITRTEKLRLGIFVTLTLIVLAGILFYMLGKNLVKKEDAYYVKYTESVAGLLPSANVKLNGVTVGRVLEMFVDSTDVRKVVVRFSVRRGTPIKTDMVANLTGGLTITGLKTIELTGGSNEAPDVPVGGEVKAGVSQLKALTGQAEAIALKFETLLNNILNLTNEEHQAMATSIIKSIYKVSMELDSMVEENRNVIRSIPENLTSTMKRLQSTAVRAETLIKDLQAANPGKRIGEAIDEYYQGGKDLRKKIKDTDIDKTAQEFQKTAVKISKATTKLDNTLTIIQEDLGSIMAHIKEASENFEDFSRMIKENPSLLLRGEDKKERGL
jgi:phospholipid/cholesterol/gamma-HCH transport system substrate-binding protein